MYYPYDPKRLTTQDKEDAELMALRLSLFGTEKSTFIKGFYCGIQNQERRRLERIAQEEQDDEV